MKWRFILFFIICFCYQSQAFSKIDSLESLLNSSDKNEKVVVLNQLSWELKFSDPALAKEYGQSALKLANEIKDKSQEAKAWYQLGVIYSITGKYQQSNEHAEHAIKLYQTFDDVAGIGRCLNLQGLNEQNRANYELALSYYNKALDVFELLDNTAYCLKIKGNIGNVNYLRGNYEAAIQSYEDLVDFSRKNRDTVTLANNLSNIGRCLNSIGSYDKALPIFFEAVELFKDTDNKHGLANIYNDLGILFFTVQMYPESLAKHRESLALFHQIGNGLNVSSGYNNIGRVFSVLEKYDSASYYFEEGLQLYEANNIKRKGEILNNIGEIKYKQGKKVEAKALFEEALTIDVELGNQNGIALHKAWLGVVALDDSAFVKSEQLLLEAYGGWASMGNKNGLLTATEHLANFYETTGKYKTALKFKAEKELLEDSIFNNQQQIELMRIMIRQQLKEKEKVLKSLENDQLKQEKLSIRKLSAWQYISLIGFVFLGILAFSWIRLNKSREKLQAKLKTQNRGIKSLETENEDLTSALEKKNQEVIFLSLSTIQKDNFVKQFSKKLKEVTTQYPQYQSLQKLSNLLYLNQVQQQDWARFKTAFEQISPGFFDKLFQRYPNLSNKELRHCAMIRLKISSKDIAEILGISVASVHKARYRLRKQLTLDRDQTLEIYLASI